MADNDIIKALECCRDCCCKQCDDEPDFQNALDLIIRQKAEKDKAWGLCKMRTDEKIELQMLCDKQKAEIERLQDILINMLPKEIEAYKNEAIKEFAEKLKADVQYCYDYGDVVKFATIEHIAKEMVGDV